MAQRVFLIQLPEHDLATTVRGIVGSPSERDDAAVALAGSAMLHLRRVTMSERVCAAVDHHYGSGAQTETLPPDWGFFRYCMPYLITRTDSAGIVSRLDELETRETEDEIMEFFWDEVRAIGLDICPVDADMQPPGRDEVTRELCDRLEGIRLLRDEALHSTEPAVVSDYAVSTWIWLGGLFARLRPCFWQGRNRWLGNAAFPFPEDAGASAPLLGFALGQTYSLEEILQANRQANSAQRAREGSSALAGILESVATLVPELGMAELAEYLPPEGSGNLTSGVVRAENLRPLRAEMQRMRQTRDFPYGNGEWIEIVDAAAAVAERAQASLLEGDDVIYGAYRWPVFA